MSETTISEVLKGLKAGPMQSIGFMQIIPLIADPDFIDEGYASYKAVMTKTSNYGDLGVANDSNQKAIFPMGAGTVTKQRAQDHASGQAIFLGPKSSHMLEGNARCIQQSQGGYLEMRNNEVTILPYDVRSYAISIIKERGYDKLWSALKRFNASVGASQQGHIEVYLQKFEKELDEFIGHFEVINGQVGAIIVLNGQVAGIERSPNYTYWKDLFKPLIRECYGSASLQFKASGTTPRPPLGGMPMDASTVTDLKSLRDEYNLTERHEHDAVKKTIRKFMKNPFNIGQIQKKGDVTVEALSGSQFTGQIVRDNQNIVYASLVPDKNAKFNCAKPFEI